MSLDEVQASKGAISTPDIRDYSAEHILGGIETAHPLLVNLNIVPSHDQKSTLRCTSYGLTHCIEILNTLEHNQKIKLNPDEQWEHQLNPPEGLQFQPPAQENQGDSLQHALKIFMRFGLSNRENLQINVGTFTALGYAAVQQTIEDYKRWLALGFPIYGGWLGHSFAIVGYDETKQILICKNSSGAEWGEKKDGTFEIDYIDIPRLFTGYIIYDKKDLTMIFKDVSDSSPMAKNIRKMRDFKIMNGYGEGSDPLQKLFMPNQPITRAEVAEVLGNFMDKFNLTLK